MPVGRRLLATSKKSENKEAKRGAAEIKTSEGSCGGGKKKKHLFRLFISERCRWQLLICAD